ncbi:MAG: EAL domain-containing protein [Clostridiales bacterium]|nr:EAL domain-containing protein [Clostridiales bacterium]
MRYEDKYKLPKARVVGPIIGHSIVFIVIIAAIFIAMNIISDYVIDVRSESDREYVMRVADQYERGTDKARDAATSTLVKDGHAYCVIDYNGKVLDSDGVITCKGYDATKNAFDTDSLNGMLTDAEEGSNAQEIHAVVLAMSDNKSFIAEDMQGSVYNWNNFSKAFKNDPNNWKHLTKGTVGVAYWIGTPVNNATEILLVKAELTVQLKDYMYMLGGMIVALVIAVIVFILLILGVVRNLNSNRKMRKVMFRDSIAPGRNWLWFVNTSQDILEKKRNEKKTYAVVALEFIKYRNFVLCHSVKEAEDLLKQVAKIVTVKLRKEELCAHSSSAGLPLLLEVTDEADARRRLEDIIGALVAIPTNYKLAFRAGVYLVNPANERAASNRRHYSADIDLYYNNACTAGMSIANGEAGIAFFDQKLVDEEKWISLVTERQQSAINNQEFVVYYQPKYDPRTDELRGAEALIRWKTADMGLIPPGKFIPIFEDNGFITQIDDYMISHIARDQRRWLGEGRKCVPISVNVSRAHFSQTDLAEHICSLVDREGAPRDLIEIELTESAFFDDENAMLTTINKLKGYGFLVSMDDFGSGYSSLNSLKDMPLDILKLDAGFFRGSENNPRTEIVVSEALKLAKSLNMLTVAEGVEEQAQVDFLAAEGCDMIQGYYYAKPMPREEYETRLPGGAPKPVYQAPVQQVAPVQQTVPVQQVAAAPVQQTAPAPVQPVAPIPVMYWACECGKTTNTGKFCGYCGKPKPVYQEPAAPQQPAVIAPAEAPVQPVAQAPVETQPANAAPDAPQAVPPAEPQV